MNTGVIWHNNRNESINSNCRCISEYELHVELVELEIAVFVKSNLCKLVVSKSQMHGEVFHGNKISKENSELIYVSVVAAADEQDGFFIATKEIE